MSVAVFLCFALSRYFHGWVGGWLAGCVVGKLESNAKLNSKVKVEVEVELGNMEIEIWKLNIFNKF